MTRYHESETLIAEAEAAERRGDDERARAAYRTAAELQWAMVCELPAERTITKSIFGSSAATLFWRAGDLDEAKRLADSLLVESWIYGHASMRLRQLLGRIRAEKAMRNRL